MVQARRRLLGRRRADHPGDATSIEWTLTLDGTTIYAIRPAGPFAAQIYEELQTARKR